MGRRLVCVCWAGCGKWEEVLAGRGWLSAAVSLVRCESVRVLEGVHVHLVKCHFNYWGELLSCPAGATA